MLAPVLPLMASSGLCCSCHGHAETTSVLGLCCILSSLTSTASSRLSVFTPAFPAGIAASIFAHHFLQRMVLHSSSIASAQRYSIAQHSTAQHSTAHQSTEVKQCHTAQHPSAKHKTCFMKHGCRQLTAVAACLMCRCRQLQSVCNVATHAILILPQHAQAHLQRQSPQAQAGCATQTAFC